MISTTHTEEYSWKAHGHEWW